MIRPKHTNRRTILKTIGAGAAGGLALTGTVSGSPLSNFGYVEDSTLEGETVTLSGPPGKEKVFCDAGGSESQINTEVWDVEGQDDPLYLIPSGYNDGDILEVGNVFTACTKNEDIKGEVPVTLV